MSTHFFEYYLRTLDVEAAGAFYRSVLGEAPQNIVPLHEQAIARGARPHWLGFLDVPDVDRAAAAFGERGATPLAPKWKNPAGLEAAVIRDPGGAIVALARPPGSDATGGAPDIAWHVLNTADVGQARRNYTESFGWVFGDPVDLGAHGVFYPFAWQKGAPPAGAMGDIAGRPNVHPHWLFHMRVKQLDAALDAVRAGGGLVVDTVALPEGLLPARTVAVCDDPQGAAFALLA